MDQKEDIHANARTTPNAKPMEVIRTNLLTRGDGKNPVNPKRWVEQFWDLEGRLLAENDPFADAYNLSEISLIRAFIFSGDGEALQKSYTPFYSFSQDLINGYVGQQKHVARLEATIEALQETQTKLRADLRLAKSVKRKKAAKSKK